MEHFTLYQKPEKVWREFILPFLSQFILVAIAIILHRLFVGRGPYILPQVTYLGELTLPTAGRLIYAVSALILSIVLSIVASGLAGKKKNVSCVSGRNICRYPDVAGSGRRPVAFRIVGVAIFAFGVMES